MDHELSLDEIGMLETTDKTFLVNDYLRHYERLLSSFRDKDINVIEIGVAQGASLRTWRRFFSKARIIGVDINPAAKLFANEAEGIFVEIGSQDDPAILKKIVAQYPPSIVIDDGSHISDHVVDTFFHLFPHLLPGGCYVMEDMFFMLNNLHAAAHRGAKPYSAVDLLLNLSYNLQIGHYVDNNIGPEWRAISSNIERIEFFRYAAALWKRETPQTLDERIAYAEHFLESATDSFAWFRLFTFIMMHGGSQERAEAILKRFLDQGGAPSLYHTSLSQLRERAGDLVGAIAEARLAIETSHDGSGVGEITRLDALLGRQLQARSQLG